MATVPTYAPIYTPAYYRATNTALFVFMAVLVIGTLAQAALSLGTSRTRPHDEESWEAGPSIRFIHTTTEDQTEDGSMGLTPRDSLSIRSTLATTSHSGDADSEQSEEIHDISSEPSEKDITDTFALTALLSMSGSGFWSADDTNPWIDQPGNELLCDSLLED